MCDLVADGIFADLALEWFVAVIEAVGCLVLDCFTAKPTPEAFEMDVLDGTLAQADIEKRVIPALAAIEADPAASLVSRNATDPTLPH